MREQATAGTGRVREFAARDGLVLRADCWGKETDPPVVLLHGGAQTRHSWKTTGARIGDLGYYAVAMDLRGHGDSDWSETPYTLADNVADLTAVVQALGTTAPTLIGASLGGIVSLLYAGEFGGHVAGLVLVDIAARVDDAGVERIKDFLLAHKDGFDSLEEAGNAVAAYLKHRKRPVVLKGLKKNVRKGADGRYYWHWDPSFIGSPLIEEVHDEERLLRAAKSVDAPILLVRGAHSDIISPEITRHFLEEVPQARYFEVGGAGHTLAGDSNDEFTEAVLDFLKSK